MVKIRVTRNDIRSATGYYASYYLSSPVSMAIRRETGFPTYYYPSGFIGIDDPITYEPDVIKLKAPRSVVRAMNRMHKRGRSTIKPFTFIMPTKEVTKLYEE